MTIHTLYIFDRGCSCIYYKEWLRNKKSGLPQDEEFKLMYGMIFSLKSFVQRMSPSDMRDGFLNFKTSKYKLHLYETATGLKFVLLTDLNVGNIRDNLQTIYSQIYVEYVVKNPLECQLIPPVTNPVKQKGQPLPPPDSSPIESELFSTKLDEYVRSLPFFA